MLKIAICDDEKISQDFLYHYLVLYFMNLNLNYQIYTYHSAQELLKHLEEEFEVIFLDIKMDSIDGIEAAKQIRTINNYVTIVFVSFTSEYALSGYGVNAFRYLLKSDLKNQLPQCMDEILSKIKYIQVTIEINGEKILIPINDILYFATVGRKIKVKLKSKEYYFYEKLAKLEKQLDEFGFIRTHQSFLINSKYIKDEIDNQLILENGEMIPISRSQKKLVKDKLIWLKRW